MTPSDHHHSDTEASGSHGAIDCTEVVARIYEYLDVQVGLVDCDDAVVSASFTHLVQVHLGDCLPCSEALDFEATWRAVLRSKCAEQMPAGIREAVGRALAAEGFTGPLP